MTRAPARTPLVSIRPSAHFRFGLCTCFCLSMVGQCLVSWGFRFILPWFPAAHESSSYATGDTWNSDIITRCLMVSSRAAVTQEQIYGLFDLIPGMDFCEMQIDQYGFSKGYMSHTPLQCFSLCTTTTVLKGHFP